MSDKTWNTLRWIVGRTSADIENRETGEQFLRELLRETTTALEADRGGCFILDTDTGEMRLAVSLAVSPASPDGIEPTERPVVASLQPDLVPHMLQPEIVSTRAARSHPLLHHLADSLFGKGDGATLCLALDMPGMPAGLLCVGRADVHAPWSREEERFAASLGGMLDFLGDRVHDDHRDESDGFDSPLSLSLELNEAGVITRFAPLRRATELIGATNPVGLEIDALLPADQREPMRLSRKEAMRGGTVPVEFTLSGQDRDTPFSGILTPGGRDRVVVAARDVSEEREAARELALSEKRYQAIFEHTGTATLMLESDTTILLVNSEFEELAGVSRKDVEGRQSWTAFFHPDDVNFMLDYHRRRRITPRDVPRNYETRLVDTQGRIRPVFMTVGMIPGTRQSVASILDMSKLKGTEQELDQQKAYFRQLFENSPQAIVLVDNEDRIITINPGFERLFGYGVDEIRGRAINDVIVSDAMRDEAGRLSRDSQDGFNVFLETRRRNRSGELIDVQIMGFPIYVGSEQVGVFGIYLDISERIRTQRELSFQAFHDPLTGFGNRVHFLREVTRAIERGQKTGDYAFSVVLFDLDRFKVINDSLGHSFGDEVLRIIAEKIAGCLRPEDALSRLASDEYAVLLSSAASLEDVSVVVDCVQQRLQTPFLVQGQQMTTSASVGVVHGSPGYTRPEDYLRDVNLALYKAKNQGKEGFQAFDTEMHEEAMQRMLLESHLRLALQRDEFILTYQPIVDIATGRRTGVEALMRWQRPDVGVVPPGRFIPLAEETGLIVPIGYWVITQACIEFEEQTRGRDDNLSLNVNISAKQFRDPNLFERIQAILGMTGLSPARLKLEITESVLMDDPDTSASVLDRFKQIGIQTCLDDFGTGYSSLAYLSRFPIDVLKIDRSFVMAGGSSQSTSGKLIQTIITLGRTMGMLVVAEGVENETQLARLRELGCDRAQGYLFSRPTELAEAIGETAGRTPNESLPD